MQDKPEAVQHEELVMIPCPPNLVDGLPVRLVGVFHMYKAHLCSLCPQRMWYAS